MPIPPPYKFSPEILSIVQEDAKAIAVAEAKYPKIFFDPIKNNLARAGNRLTEAWEGYCTGSLSYEDILIAIAKADHASRIAVAAIRTKMKEEK